ncbi:MAG: hypothetical protein ACXVRI_12665, partial [Gaiellaceae bacterium]
PLRSTTSPTGVIVITAPGTRSAARVNKHALGVRLRSPHVCPRSRLRVVAVAVGGKHVTDYARAVASCL